MHLLPTSIPPSLNATQFGHIYSERTHTLDVMNNYNIAALYLLFDDQTMSIGTQIVGVTSLP